MGQLHCYGQTSPVSSLPSLPVNVVCFIYTHAIPVSDVYLCLTFTKCAICTGAVPSLIKAFTNAEYPTCPDHL